MKTPRTGAACGCRRGVERDNCPRCEGSGKVIDFAAIRAAASFPGYPHLRRTIISAQYGRMELLEVSRTSDGFLVGLARIGEGEGAYIHSVFLGEDPGCQRSATQSHDVTCDRHGR